MDVIVTLPKSRGGLEHLFDKVGMPSYWEFKRRPKDLKKGDRIYVVCEGAIEGSFMVEFFDTAHELWLAYLSDWVPFDPPIPHEPVRGFQYVRDRGKLRGATKDENCRTR